jgi:hypothetical protein
MNSFDNHNLKSNWMLSKILKDNKICDESNSSHPQTKRFARYIEGEKNDN